MGNIKAYSLDEAVRMLPYILSYCRSIKLLFLKERKRVAICETFENLITLDVAKRQQMTRILDKLEQRSEYGIACAKRWKAELMDINVFTCCPNLGILDIPVWDETTERVMLLCVQHGTTVKDLYWHKVDENYEHARVCWANPNKYGKRMVGYARN